MTSRPAAVLVFLLLVLISQTWLMPAPQVWAGPDMQGPAATEEPTKSPYVFPTPIFIPTYAGDKSTPPAQTAAPTRVSAQPAVERTYTVVPGDNPWLIAQKMYGNGAKYQVIMTANGITDPSKLKVGMVLKIPDTDAAGQPLPTPMATAVAAQAPSSPTPIATTVQPAPTGGPSTPVATPTKTPEVGVVSLPELTLVLNILSAILLLGSIGSGVLAYLVYRRSRRIAGLTTMPRRLRLRK